MNAGTQAEVIRYEIRLWNDDLGIWVKLKKTDVFTDPKKAIACRDKLNQKFFGTIHPQRDHYDVVIPDPDGSDENTEDICCPQQDQGES